MTSITPPSSLILILGIGNWLMGDEGFGVHFTRYLQTEKLYPGIDVVDGGTGGFHLMGYFESYPTLIIVDATLDDRAPGTIRLIEPHFSTEFPSAMSTHDIGLKDLINGLQILGKLPKIYLFVVSISTLQDMCIELSPEVKAAMPLLKTKVLALCHKLIPTFMKPSNDLWMRP